MTALTTVIVDDERLARQNLRRLLRAHPSVEVVGEAKNAREAEKAIRWKKPDLVFLDIQMPGGSGFDLLERLVDPPRIVFVTAYDRYAIRAFEVNAVDYLLKPIEPDRLAVAVARVMTLPALSGETRGALRYDDSVLLNTGRSSFFIPLADIAMIQADGNYTHIMCGSGNCHTVRRSLKEWESLLPVDDFVPLDRATLVNRHHVRQWNAEGREAAVHLADSAHPLHLGRTATRRFKKMVEGEKG